MQHAAGDLQAELFRTGRAVVAMGTFGAGISFWRAGQGLVHVPWDLARRLPALSCDSIRAGLHIKAGRDFDKEPLAGYELMRWLQFENKLVVCDVAGKPRGVKRLVLETSRCGPRVLLHADNQRMFRTWAVCAPVSIVGLVEMVIPMTRDRAVLPAELQDEYDRLAAG